LISDRPQGVCNFLDAPDLVFPKAGSVEKDKDKGKGRAVWDKEDEDDTRVIYRHYATLYFVWV
jgi:AP-3 complex subunit sigma